MANTMKAAVFDAIKTIKVREVPIPEIGDDEVLIKVKNTGICGTDWSIYNGWYSADKLPMIAGHEFSGVIAQAGKNTKNIKEGDRVTADINMSCGVCYYCIRGDQLLCNDFTQLGIHTNGTYAEYVKAPAYLVHHLPDALSFEEGAFIEPLSCCIHAAKAMNARVGGSVAIVGCGLGVLHARMAYLHSCAPIIVIGDNKHRLSIARQMGADFIIDAVGKISTYEQAFAMVRKGGTMSAFGITGENEVMQIRPFEFVL